MPSRWFTLAVLTGTLALALAACSKKQESFVAASAPAAASAAGADAADGVSSKMQAFGSAQSESGTTASTVQQLSTSALTAIPKGRQLVRTVQLNFSVKDVYVASLAIEEAVAAHDGYVASSVVNSQVLQQSQYPAEAGKALRIDLIETSRDIQLRLPSAKAALFMRSMAGHIETLAQRSMTAQDVQFDLLRQQLEAARAQATALELAQLNQQEGRIADKNKTIAQRRQAAIEANEAQLSKLTLADQVEFATVNLHLSQPSFVRKTTVVDFETAQSEHRPAFTVRAAQSLSNGWAGLQAFVIDLLALWPLWLGLAGLIALWRSTRLGQMLRRFIRSTTKETTS